MTPIAIKDRSREGKGYRTKWVAANWIEVPGFALDERVKPSKLVQIFLIAYKAQTRH